MAPVSSLADVLTISEAAQPGSQHDCLFERSHQTAFASLDAESQKFSLTPLSPSMTSMPVSTATSSNFAAAAPPVPMQRPSTTSFYLDCTDTGRPKSAWSKINDKCREVQKLYADRRMYGGGASSSLCLKTIYVHDTNTGSWEECCRLSKPGKPGAGLLSRIIGMITSPFGKVYECRALSNESLNLAWGGDGVGIPRGVCVKSSSEYCDQPGEVCLRPKTIGAQIGLMSRLLSTGTSKRKSICLQVGSRNESFKGVEDAVAYPTTKAGVKGSMWSHDVVYLESPWPIAILTAPPARTVGRGGRRRSREESAEQEERKCEGEGNGESQQLEASPDLSAFTSRPSPRLGAIRGKAAQQLYQDALLSFL